MAVRQIVLQSARQQLHKHSRHGAFVMANPLLFTPRATAASPAITSFQSHGHPFQSTYGGKAFVHDFMEGKPEKELTPYQKLQKWLQPFVQGFRAMYAENKQAWAIRSRLKASSAEGKEAPVLTRQEMMILRQAHRDLLKSLPLLCFFCIPIVGYAAPLVGYQFPKQLLPWQFWRPDQKTQFLAEDAQARAKYYPELVKLLLQIDKKDKCLQEMLQTAKTGGDDVADKGLNPAQLGELVPFFDNASGPAGLPQLSTYHVQVLTRSTALFPAFAVLLQFLPKSFLMQHLEKRMDELRVDDEMLLKEGLEELSLSELEFAAEERGIVNGYGDIEELREALQEWLTMYDPKTPQRFPSSLLLHAPALARFSAVKTK